MKDGHWALKSFDYRSDLVLELNQSAPLVLDQHYFAYLRFFMHVVRSDEGPFRLIDSPWVEGSTAWPYSPRVVAGRLGAAKRKGKLGLSAPVFDGVDSSGRLRYSTHVMYSGVLFEVELALSLTGSVEMVNERQIQSGE